MKFQQPKNKRLYDAAWQKARLVFLEEHPLCSFCLLRGEVVAATVVDHKIPHRGCEKLFWDKNNWQSLCQCCHDSTKQAIEKRGYSLEVDASGWPIDGEHPANAFENRKKLR